MADRKTEMSPNKSGGNEKESPTLIVLQPVISSPDEEAGASISLRPKRAKREWPPRSPSPSQPIPRKVRQKGKVHVEGAKSKEVIVIKDEDENDKGKEASAENGRDSAGGDFNFDIQEVSEEIPEEVQVTEIDGSDGTASSGSKGKRTRSKGQLWQHVCSLPSEEMFQKWKTESDEKIFPAKWSKHRTNETKSALKRYYICSARGCRAQLTAVYPNDSETVEVLRNGKDHFHPPLVRQWGLSTEAKQEVKRLWDLGIRKPRLVKAALDKVGLGGNCTRRLSNHLRRLRGRSDPSKPYLSMNALDAWCTEHSITQPTAALDEDIDRVYVFDHKVDATMRQFRFVLTSKRLIKFAAQASTINLDASHCLKWFDASVLFVGVSDASGQFFPVLFAVMSQETTANYSHLLKMLKQCVEAATGSKFRPGCVIGHGDANLAESVSEVFPRAARRLCWLQVKKEAAAVFKHVDKEIRDVCEKDLDALRLSCSKEQFELASKLMIKKWRDLLPSSEAPSMFEEQFVKLNPGWYEGFDIESHSSNKSMMLLVNSVRNRHTMRERLPLERYLILAMELVLEWSVGVSEVGELQNSSQPDKTLLIDTCRLQSEQKTMVEVNSAIYVPVGDRTAASVSEVDAFESKMQGEVESFDEFVEARMSLWKVEDTGDKSDLSLMRCTCPRFLRYKLCEHVLAISSAFGLFTLPQSAWDSIDDLPDGKRRRGRPKKKSGTGHSSVDYTEMTSDYAEGNDF